MSKTCMVFLAAVVVALAACGGEMPASDGGTDGGDTSAVTDGAISTPPEYVGTWQRTTTGGLVVTEHLFDGGAALVTVSNPQMCGGDDSDAVNRTWHVDSNGALVFAAATSGCTIQSGCSSGSELAPLCMPLVAGGTFPATLNGATLTLGGSTIEAGTYTRQ